MRRALDMGLFSIALYIGTYELVRDENAKIETRGSSYASLIQKKEPFNGAP